MAVHRCRWKVGVEVGMVRMLTHADAVERKETGSQVSVVTDDVISGQRRQLHVRRRRGGGGGGQDQTGVQVVAAGKRKIRFHSETKELLCYVPY